ncbi:MAG: T9SS type A sorting domain-containing protein [Bacteroidia bacterium]|nr:T9SS type A sorting domain-containing protein [Bacteroidia bacterium]
MYKSLLLFLISTLLLPAIANTCYAQIIPNTGIIYYYNYTPAVYVDSLRVVGSDSIYYLRKLPVRTFKQFNECLPMKINTILGSHIIKRVNDIVVFNKQNDSIFFDYNQTGNWNLQHKNDSLQLLIFSKITDSSTDTIFGETIPVSVLSFLFLNYTGDTLKNHWISQSILKISNKYGWITTYNWNNFPYNASNEMPVKLIGIMSKNGSSRKGTYNKFTEHTRVYEPGDEIHEESFSAYPNSGYFRYETSKSSTIKKILSKQIYTDSTLYMQYRTIANRHAWISNFTANDSVVTTFVIDTVRLVIDFSALHYPYNLNSFWETITNNYHNGFYFDPILNKWAYNDMNYLRWSSQLIYYECWRAKPEPGDPSPNFVYYDGIGGPYGEDHYGGIYSSYNKLLYFKTTSGKWGIPLNIDEIKNHTTFTIFPNPASTEITITTGNTHTLHFSLYDMMMETVYDITTPDAQKLTLPILNSGIYFYRITDMINNHTVSGKLLLEH